MPIPAASVADDAPWADDMDAAAHAGLGQVPVTPGSEQAGFLVANADGKYAYSNPVTQNHHDNFALKAQIKAGHKLAGIFHTHPGKDSDGQIFSPHDIEVANQLKVPSYVLFLKDGTVRKYTPGKTQTYSYPMQGTSGVVSKGDEVPLPKPPPVVAAPPIDPGAALQQGLAGTLPPQPVNPLQGLQASTN